MNDLNLLEGLLRSYSPTGEESSAVSFLVDAMRRLGFEARVDRTGNAVGVLGGGPRELVLLGHIDTVPGQIPVRREGDRLYGRGAVDAKGPLACFTAAAARLGARPGWRVVVIGALAEEGDSHGARGILEEYHPEAAVIGEPSGWDHVTLGYKGSAWFRYEVEKSMVHTAAKAESAPETAVAFWNAVAALAAEQNQGKERAFDQLTPNLRAVQSTRGEFSESASLEINFRLPTTIQADRLNAAANRAGRRRQAGYDRPDPRLPQRKEHLPGARVPPRHPRRGRNPGILPQNRHRGYEHRCACLGLPGSRLRPRRFRARPHPKRAHSHPGV